MIPYRDTIPLRYTPWITWGLILVNFLVFAYSEWLPLEAHNYFNYLHGLVPARYTFPEWAGKAGFPAGDYTPFVTSIFMHGSWLHIVTNMWMLWIFGDNVEDRMGGVRFLAFYLLCGLVAGGLHVYFNPQSLVPTLGASGALAGVMGAYFFLFPYARIVIWVFFLPLFVRVPAIAFLGVWVIIQFYKITTPAATGDHIADVAWWGHLGGFSAGMLLYRLFLLPERNEPEDSPFTRWDRRAE
ncbi:Membrane associated serine protease, rhomboid family [Methylomagnum ishizawai]|uniref:Membrane associated serine protease, rhomboid family n=1 Tax=Methylomagnum ishizawai TaxID=1760988 RepID=A0A1Y6CT18_9GAMM|nr:rhomboid family intramembrane serine protease [Methylomagnum ishizawai]SMF93779.1 Membrane associated serine protease, rhomboid family [Methylomagnum ishizawai]